jgi:hypothetical protein
MDKDFKDFDDLFREEASAYTEMPAPAVWQALEKRLDKDKKRRVFPFRWYWFFGLLSFVTLLAAYVFSDRVRGPQEVVVIAPAMQQTKELAATTSGEVDAPTAKGDANEHIVNDDGGAQTEDRSLDETVHEETNNETENKTVKCNIEKTETYLSGNAPALGTSIYSYDDFEEKNTQVVAPVPEHENTTPLANSEYVASKVKKHNMVVVEMAPATDAQRQHTAIAEHSKETILPNRESNVGAENRMHKSKRVHGGKRNHNNTVVAIAHKVSRRISKQQKAVASEPLATKMNVVNEVAHNTNEVRNDKTAQPVAVAQNVPKTASTKEANKTEAAEKKIASVSFANKQPLSVRGSSVTSKRNAEPAKKSVDVIPVKETEKIASTRQVIAINKATKTVRSQLVVKNTESSNHPVKNYAVVASVQQLAATKLHKANAHESVTSDTQPEVAVATKKASGRKGAGVLATSKPKVNSTITPKAKEVVLRSDKIPEANTGNKEVAAATESIATNAKQKKQAMKPATAVPAIAVSAKNRALLTKAAPILSLPLVSEAQEDISATVLALAAAAPKDLPKPISSATKTSYADSVSIAADTTKQEVSAVMKLVLGIKAGFERGAGTYGNNKLVAAPYLQYKIGNKLSLMVQPSIKGANAAKRTIGTAASYYSIKPGTENYQFQDSQLVYLVLTGDSLWRRNYNTSEKYDSILKTSSIGGSYVELELPLLLQYSLSSRLSVYGGLNAVYSKRLGVKEDTKVTESITSSGTTFTMAPINAPAPLPSSTGIAYSGSPLSNYTGPAYPQQDAGLLRMGYMLGVSYELKKRWMADMVVQQCFTKKNMQGGYNVNGALSMPYIRLTLGYRLSK